MDSPYAELVVMFAGAVLAIVGILNSFEGSTSDRRRPLLSGNVRDA